MAQQDGGAVMAVRDLQVAYKRNGQSATVLNKLAFTLKKGEIVALLGESGSGKSTIAKAVTGLLPPSAHIGGGTLLLGSETAALGGKTDWGRIRGRRIGMLFQDARLALNPLVRIKTHFKECLVYHRIASVEQSASIGAELLRLLGFDRPRDVLERYPFELSGGMCQRVCLALAICLKPEALIADEPTSALDTVSQKEVLDLLLKLQRELGLSVLFITHDIAAANAISNRVIVLNRGVIEEEGDTAVVLSQPRAPYTRSLLSAREQLSVVSDGDGKAPPTKPLLEMIGLQKSFDRMILRDVHLTLHEGEILGILGQSGSGKSTLAKCIAGLEKPDAGKVMLGGDDISRLQGKRRREYCKRLQLIFQDARASLNARRSALQLVQEPLHYLKIGNRKAREETAKRYLDEVGIVGDMQARKPAQLSTGQCQRIAIARALALGPQVLLCDEAVSALDMSVQSQILALLRRLHKQFGFSIVMISHDIRVLRSFCHNIAVMDEGRFREVRRASDLHESRSPHTQLLLQCASDMEAGM
ncbi:ABC transporter ATP-binding protein [Paenibacillaceae bacterium WGS1546]|uniref:ABC transporter ATP-binding protein n=1 Tax=Cohnella sp. WGS1546 TaxID=3366810 RepID=UPI00372D53F7